ncbi:phosphoribosylanthranilate isomerase [Leucobacter sp. GX24907]
MYIKICGLRDVDDADFAVRSGADAIGIVMSAGSPRNADEHAAADVVEMVAGRADTVLVVSRTPVAEAVERVQHLGIDVLQLHGDYIADDFAFATEALPRVWRAASLERTPDIRAGEYGEELLLLDGTTGGAGERWDLNRIDTARIGERWILAGGLAPDNVSAAIAEARPWGVDVSSGVESAPGVKSQELIGRFIAAARNA